VSEDGYVMWLHALDYVTKLNNENYLGHTDWRLPNINELLSLINDDEANSATWLNSQGFNNVQSGTGYWSSTAGYPPGGYFTWGAFMGDGDMGPFANQPLPNRGFGYYDCLCVWPVRAGQCGIDTSVICLPKTGQTASYYAGDDGALQKGVAWPNPRFTDNGNGTVTDNLTGLMWTKDAKLSGGVMLWQQALDYVKTLNTGGYTDWRLPNRSEQKSLIDYHGGLPQGHPFINVLTPHQYWSSTTYASSPSYAWYFYSLLPPEGSYKNQEYSDKSSYNVYVWPVRTGGSSGTSTISSSTTSSSTTTTTPVTVITLSSFTATPKNRDVILEWKTESEIDNAGFNLYRSTSESGEYIKINDSLIPSQGSSTQGASYEFVDKDVKNRKTYYYKLEDIDLKGTATMHGPVSATPRWIRRIFGK
jgi:hypothetical protein